MMNPSSRTPLKTEGKWCLVVFLVVSLISIAGFAVFIARLRAL